jgi:hypothetical protein
MRVWAGVEMANRRGCGGFHFSTLILKGAAPEFADAVAVLIAWDIVKAAAGA